MIDLFLRGRRPGTKSELGEFVPDAEKEALSAGCGHRSCGGRGSCFDPDRDAEKHPCVRAQASSVPSSAFVRRGSLRALQRRRLQRERVSSEVTEESPVSSFLEQLEEELGISSSETASSSEVSSAASASKADSVSSAVSSSSAAHSVPASSAASGSHAPAVRPPAAAMPPAAPLLRRMRWMPRSTVTSASCRT